jgi:hypothetical protein
MAKAVNTLDDLKRHSKAVEDHFFDSEADRSLGTTSIHGIYRAILEPLTDGYVITVNGSNEDPHAYVYRFETGPASLLWFPIGRHESLEDAEGFLASMGVRK